MSAQDNWEFKFSLPELAGGRIVELSPEEAELNLLNKLSAAKDDPKDALWQLARFYSQTKQHELALDYLRQVMDLQADMDSKAASVLAMGQTMEQAGDYEAAMRYYREAFALEPMHTPTWYFINNNLGFALNTLGKFDEGEQFCRAAVKIDAQRPNAFKNLGIALRARGEFAEAAQCFIQATRTDASDPRATRLLAELLAQHPELGLATELEYCQKAVGFANERRQDAQPVVQGGIRRQLILLRMQLISCWKRWWT
jgi:tetratricopeptide (TPR) repeat protein